MRPEISERWARAMAAIPVLEAMALEQRAVAMHLGPTALAEFDTPLRALYDVAHARASALYAMVEYLRSLASLTAEPVLERFATDAQAEKYGATHMLLVRVPGMQKITRKRVRKAAQ